MRISFSPKEALSFIAKSVVLAAAVGRGIPVEHAELAGGFVEGTIKGFGYTPKEKSIHQQLNSTIKRSIESVLHAPDYEIPDDCVEHLANVFTFEKAIRYLQSSESLSMIKGAIQEALSQSYSCDVSTLPLDQISEHLLQQIYCDIYSNHELSMLMTMVQVEDINKKLDTVIHMVTAELASDHPGFDTPDYIAQRSIESAEAFSNKFTAQLFSESERSDPLRLCDVYVEPHVIDTTGTEYDSFRSAYSECNDEMAILFEGEAGSGKSSLLMKIADQYLKGEIFRGNTVFFVQGKDIRHSKGDPIGDILRVLKLQSVESLDNTIVILDAYDEISYAAASPEKNQEYLHRLIYGCEGFTIIIMARTDYIKSFNGPRYKLVGFNHEQRKDFLAKYNAYRDPKNRHSQSYIDSLTQEDSYYEDGIYELLSIPMLLYMIAIRTVNISEIRDKFDLYEIVFAPDGQGIMYSRGKDRKAISQKIWGDSYNLALTISKRMLFSNDPFISEVRIRSFIDDMNIPEETKSILKNRFGIEIFLSGSDNSIYTFVHRSIFEYFAAKSLCTALTDIIHQYLHEEKDIDDVISALNSTFPADYYSESVFYYLMYAINRGYVIDVMQSEENIYRIESLFHQLLASQLCNSGSRSTPYVMRLKNLLLWVFNSFSVMFGMYEINENAHWVKIDHSILQYLLRIKESDDTLMIAHCDLRNLFLYKYDLGSVYFIENDLTGAVLKEANCTQIVSISQAFHSMDMRSADFWKGDYSGFSFNNSDLRYSDFRNSILRGASFRGADLRCCHFTNAQMYGADFTGAHIYLEDFEDALYDADAFENAIIYDLETDDADEDVLHLIY